jgi:predicted nuclease of predicted toxin-antitoxin system
MKMCQKQLYKYCKIMILNGLVEIYEVAQMLLFYQKAVAEQRILVTLDRDFIQLRLFSNKKLTIILLRFKLQRPQIMANQIKNLIASFSAELKNKLIILSAEGTIVY